MQRRMTITLGEVDLDLAASFDASVEIGDKVSDPLMIAREAALEAQLAAAGQIYEPRFKLSVKNVPLILFIGAKAAGDKRTLKEVQEMVFDHGFIEARAMALDYIALIVTPRSEEDLTDTKGEPEPGE